jgi:hypothetical protein
LNFNEEAFQKAIKAMEGRNLVAAE